MKRGAKLLAPNRLTLLQITSRQDVRRFSSMQRGKAFGSPTASSLTLIKLPHAKTSEDFHQYSVAKHLAPSS
jgi:hypothetical protein